LAQLSPAKKVLGTEGAEGKASVARLDRTVIHVTPHGLAMW
jgi:hypothetical protein